MPLCFRDAEDAARCRVYTRIRKQNVDATEALECQLNESATLFGVALMTNGSGDARARHARYDEMLERLVNILLHPTADDEVSAFMAEAFGGRETDSKIARVLKLSIDARARARNALCSRKHLFTLALKRSK